MLPAFYTVTASMTFPTSGLYRIANQAVGDTLKMDQNGNALGAMKLLQASLKRFN